MAVAGAPGAWLVPVETPGGLPTLAQGVTAISFVEAANSAVAPAMIAQLQAAWRFGDEGVVVPRLASDLKTLLANMRASDAGEEVMGRSGGAAAAERPRPQAPGVTAGGRF